MKSSLRGSCSAVEGTRCAPDTKPNRRRETSSLFSRRGPRSAARRIRTCNQGIQGPSRFREAWTISSSPPRTPSTVSSADAETILARRVGEAGRSWRGLLLGLTPLVSEPSWPPVPDQAWLRIAVPETSRASLPARPKIASGRRVRSVSNASGLGFPQFTRFAVGGRPPLPPFFDESPALPLS